MVKKEIKQLIHVIILFILDIAVAYLITRSLGIQNTVIFHSYTTTVGDITWEVLILWLLLLLETPIFNKIDRVLEKE